MTPDDAAADPQQVIADLERKLAESVAQQTAAADVLKVISRSTFDLNMVTTAILQAAAQLCRASLATLHLRDGDVCRLVTQFGLPEAFEQVSRDNPIPARYPLHSRRQVHAGEFAQFTDAWSDSDYLYKAVAKLGGYRAIIVIPMMREDDLVGIFSLARPEPEPFTPGQIKLVQTFADQALIAIENTRLFNEVEAKTRDLSEALERQTATADVLKVISRSTFDLQVVLDTLVESAARLCDDPRASIYLLRDGLLHLEAAHNISPDWVAYRRSHPLAPGRDTPSGRAALTGLFDHVPDLLEDPDFARHDLVKLGDYRATLNIPLTREGATVGVLSLARPTPGPFTQRQVELAQTFADQAVIAIENVRLFDEVKAKTRDLTESLQQQTATAEVLKVISRSAFDLSTVLDTLVESVSRLCRAEKAGIVRPVDGWRYVATFGMQPDFKAYWDANALPIGRGSVVGRAVSERATVHVPDVETDPEYTVREGQRLGGFRTVLAVPLLREGDLIGVLGLMRDVVQPFTVKEIQLAQTFADQAVIAIENVRLFDEVQQRTRELSKSLDDLRTAQDRLIQTEKLASLGQLTAGIAHEIKNPLNFVNNFAALSAELTDELNDVLKPTELTDSVRAEVDELTGLLKENLEKVVQHGKRADSIVKNMLLHSREGSGEHRPADINSLLDESLNLAYHGARAEKGEFNITLDRDFDVDAGTIELFPQEITRAFLNLIANGVYAATRRKNEGKEPGFEPTLRATTKNLGTSVEIRIRDNGTGIPAEVREKMFNPFFTTKPAGQGTGLGLSMTHDIIVKQHGGRIDVATEPGQFTEITIVLPRKSNLSDKDRGET